MPRSTLIRASIWLWPRSATASCWPANASSAPKNGLRLGSRGPTLRAMAEEPIALLRAAQSPAARTVYSGGHGFTAAQVRFERAELNRILTLYGRMVSAGEWRDYAIDFLDDVAVFSVFRRTSARPLFRVEKGPKLRAMARSFGRFTTRKSGISLVRRKI